MFDFFVVCPLFYYQVYDSHIEFRFLGHTINIERISEQRGIFEKDGDENLLKSFDGFWPFLLRSLAGSGR